MTTSLVVFLIQTALQQEFRAVASVLRREAATVRSAADQAFCKQAPAAALDPRRLASGWIGDRFCWVLKTGVGQKAARREVNKALTLIDRPALLVSVGFAGALSRQLRVGEKFIVHKVQVAGGEPRTLGSALDRLASNYVKATAGGLLLTVDQPALNPASKSDLARESTAVLCDMETHAVAAVATEHGLPWLCARIVSDSAQETLQEWILQLPSLVEECRWIAFFRQMGTHAQDLPGLLRLAFRMRTLQRQLAQFTVEFILNVVES